MDYTDEMKQALALMNRTDFKNLSKSDVLSIVSKLNELQPDVAKEVIKQYPEFVKLLQSSMVEYRDILEKLSDSDDASINQFYSTTDKELNSLQNSRKEYFDLADKIRGDLSKCLDDPNITEEERSEIRAQELEILDKVGKKDQEIADQEMKIVDKVDKKDDSKRNFNWKAIGAASTVVAFVAGIGIVALGGHVNIKLPNNKA